MLRNALVVPFILSLACSCGSAPARPSTGEPGSRTPVAAVAPTVAEAASTPARAEPVKPRPVLGPGRCEDGFDCVDTVGFPPSGYRWDCVRSKCERAKLPSLGSATPPAEASATAENATTKSKPRKSGRRRN